MMNCQSRFNVTQFDYIIPSLSGIGAISLIYPTYIYVRSYIRGDLKISKWLFHFGFAFFISIILCYVNHAVVSMFLCHNGSIFDAMEIPLFFLYIFQGVTLLAILFQRLVLIFRHKRVSKLAISRCTIRIFYSLFTSVVSSSMIGTILYASSSGAIYTIAIYLLMLAAIQYLFMMIWLNALFIHKICRIYIKNGQDSELLDMTIKTAILCAISTLLAGVYLIGRFLYLTDVGAFGSLQSYFVNRFVLMADLHTNYLSVMLSYNYFNTWYLNVCGCCHSQCASCWNFCFCHHEQLKHGTMMQMVANISSSRSIPDVAKNTPLPSPVAHPEIESKADIEI